MDENDKLDDKYGLEQEILKEKLFAQDGDEDDVEGSSFLKIAKND